MLCINYIVLTHTRLALERVECVRFFQCYIRVISTQISTVGIVNRIINRQELEVDSHYTFWVTQNKQSHSQLQSANYSDMNVDS